jgi:hypothetical protein
MSFVQYNSENSLSRRKKSVKYEIIVVCYVERVIH